SPLVSQPPAAPAHPAPPVCAAGGGGPEIGRLPSGYQPPYAGPGPGRLDRASAGTIRAPWTEKPGLDAGGTLNTEIMRVAELSGQAPSGRGCPSRLRGRPVARLPSGVPRTRAPAGERWAAGWEWLRREFSLKGAPDSKNCSEIISHYLAHH